MSSTPIRSRLSKGAGRPSQRIRRWGQRSTAPRNTEVGANACSAYRTTISSTERPEIDQHLPENDAGVAVRLRARALGRLPLQQVVPADEAAVDHAHDGVHREPGLMRQEGDHHHRADQFIGRALPSADGALDVPRQPVQQRREPGDDDGEPHHQAPCARRR